MARRQKSAVPTFPVTVSVLPSSGFRISLDPDGKERDQLAILAGVSSVDAFHAELVFSRWRKNGVEVKGRIEAVVTQPCVVTLEPVTSPVREDIDRIFVPEGSKLAKPKLDGEGELVLDYDGGDIPDTFSGETIDAWEIVIEHFQLGIDPFPRSRDAAVREWTSGPAGSTSPVEGGGRENPFAVLAKLKPLQKGGK